MGRRRRAQPEPFSFSVAPPLEDRKSELTRHMIVARTHTLFMSTHTLTVRTQRIHTDERSHKVTRPGPSSGACAPASSAPCTAKVRQLARYVIHTCQVPHSRPQNTVQFLKVQVENPYRHMVTFSLRRTHTVKK